jgi:cation transport regulator
MLSLNNMPYSKNSDLPDNVRKVLPQKAKTIFRKAFNNAHIEYKDEITAFKVAWSAVKKQYKKVNNKWVEK